MGLTIYISYIYIYICTICTVNILRKDMFMLPFGQTPGREQLIEGYRHLATCSNLKLRLAIEFLDTAIDEGMRRPIFCSVGNDDWIYHASTQEVNGGKCVGLVRDP